MALPRIEANTGVFSVSCFYAIYYNSQDACSVKLLLSVWFSVRTILVMFWPNAFFAVMHDFFVSTVDSPNDTVSLLGPIFCVACFDSCLVAVVH